MKALVQRVSQARVVVGAREVSSIGRGLLVFLGVEKGDAGGDLDYLAKKVANLRIFADQDGKMNLSVNEIGGEVLVVSQFTLAADTRKGNRPSFGGAEDPVISMAVYEDFIGRLASLGVKVSSGEFAADMAVHLVNDGPVTIMIESRPGWPA